MRAQPAHPATRRRPGAAPGAARGAGGAQERRLALRHVLLRGGHRGAARVRPIAACRFSYQDRHMRSLRSIKPRPPHKSYQCYRLDVVPGSPHVDRHNIIFLPCAATTASTCRRSRRPVAQGYVVCSRDSTRILGKVGMPSSPAPVICGCGSNDSTRILSKVVVLSNPSNPALWAAAAARRARARAGR